MVHDIIRANKKNWEKMKNEPLCRGRKPESDKYGAAVFGRNDRGR